MVEKNFPGAFAELRAILTPYAPEMEVIADTNVEYGLNTHWQRPKDGYPGYFGSVKLGKRYVSYYLMACTASPNWSTISHHTCGSACRARAASTSPLLTPSFLGSLRF